MAQQKVGLSHFRNTDGFGADVTKTRSQMSQSSDKNEDKLKRLISKWKILGELEKQNSNTVNDTFKKWKKNIPFFKQHLLRKFRRLSHHNHKTSTTADWYYWLLSEVWQPTSEDYKLRSAKQQIVYKGAKQIFLITLLLPAPLNIWA